MGECGEREEAGRRRWPDGEKQSWTEMRGLKGGRPREGWGERGDPGQGRKEPGS